MKRITTLIIGAAAMTGFGLGAIAPADAAGAFGNWKRPNGSTAKTYSCGGKMCGKVVAGKGAGFQMFTGIKKAGGNTWKGNMKHPKMGSRMNFNGTVQYRGGKLYVKGCMIGGLFCDSEVWSPK
ncbi:MAG: hypothetical protein C0605_12900 [Hyphomicrobiales bacterium]|nr:MAG: hypothetical protein C0605_12900 [Hyphomicrobiales bacterium]